MANDTEMAQSKAISRAMRRSGSGAPGWPDLQTSPPRFGRLALGVAVAGALALGVLGTLAYGVWFNEDQQTYADAIASARKTLGVSANAPLAIASTGALTQRDVRPGSASRAQRGARSADQVDANANAATMPVGAYTTDSADAPTAAITAQAQSDADNGALNSSLSSPLSDATSGTRSRLLGEWSGQVARAPANPVDGGSATTASNDPDAAAPDAAAPNAAATTLSSNTPTAREVATTPANSRAAGNARRGTAHASNGGSAARRAREARLAQQQRNGNGAGSNAKHDSNLFARVREFFRRASYRQHDSGHQQQDIYSHP